MPPPFHRVRVAISNTHVRIRDPHGPRCRVVVVPDPRGEQHQVHLVRDGERFEDVMQRVVQQLVA
jgi:hypothetical protein